MLSKDEMIQAANKKLAELSVELTDLKSKAGEVSADAKEQYDSGIKELNGLIDEAQVTLDEAMNASEESWSHIKNQVEVTTKALKHSFNYFKSQLK